MPTKKQFKSVSMTGRLAYMIMCAERFLIEKYPNRNWKPLFGKIWSGTDSMWWDDFYEFMLELTEGFLFDPDSTNDDFRQLNEDEVKEYRILLSGITEDTDAIFETLHDFAEAYAYSSIPGYGKSSIDIMFRLVEMLRTNHVELPNPDKVAFSSFEERNGWGDRFDGQHLSILK